MLSTTLRDCLHSNKQNVCIACKVAYLDLNNFYMDMEKGSKGKVCFDLQDNVRPKYPFIFIV